MPEPTAPFATLYIENVRSGRTAMAFGERGKYEFRWSDEHQRLVRAYASEAVFASEEADMRKNRNQHYVILTMLGSTNPLINSVDAVKALIAAGRTTSIVERRRVLGEIVEMAEAECARIDAPIDEPPAPPATDKKPEGPTAVALRADKWRDRNGVPEQITAPPADGSLTTPVQPGGIHTHAELMTGPWPDVQDIARKLDIPLTRPNGGGAKSRAVLVEEILAAEQKAA